MNIMLAKTLVEKKLLNQDVEIEVEYDTFTLGNLTRTSTTSCFMITSIKKTESDNLVFIARNVIDGNVMNIRAEQIIRIDGMIPERFASVYGISVGGNVKDRKRRGRKPQRPLYDNEQDVTRIFYEGD